MRIESDNVWFTYTATKIETMSVLNLNIGILGHVDSGKTSLAKVLSSTSSTACFDKNPQSQERGITIDLGFSSLLIDFPKTLDLHGTTSYDKLQYTFVDCPGHASLIRTIIGGAQIIDLMILVIDVVKGVQTQTAECLVIGEILCPKMIVVLNKIDQIEENKRQQVIDKVTKKMKLTLADTVFKDCAIIPVSANPADGSSIGITALQEALEKQVYLPDRRPDDPVVFSVDHCFSIRGSGTVMTGTLWQGTVRINDAVEIPSLKLVKKVKSIQIYRRNVERGTAGDRLAVCVTQFDPKLLERGIVCTPGYLTTVHCVVSTIHKVRYFRGPIASKAKFHISIGHDTVIGKVTLFCRTDLQIETSFDKEEEYLYRESLQDIKEKSDEVVGTQFALIEFEKPILVVPNSLYISSKLDMDVHTNSCRIAFYGKILEVFSDKNYTQTVLPGFKIYKNKSKTGLVDRIVNDYEVVCKNMFKKETRIDLFSGLKVSLSSGESGVIEGGFGQSGKVRVRIPEGIKSETVSKMGTKKGKRGKQDTEEAVSKEDFTVELRFKSYLFRTDKKIVQNTTE
ncbi:selenocysteine-specific elongation factor-like [Macrosteles quadrilineatus]|uniref:selenocysteine-specific elongation factor-like n=1 Tax=Macrosteles quadrilineatus TaxID=74068 RepID=UPI0023E2012D|nr:selenocysteine-specific elongation factor-like [Macrosteles quadrilineatus]